MYFDAVLNERLEPSFNGTPEETLEFLRHSNSELSVYVCIGRTLEVVTVLEYMNRSE